MKQILKKTTKSFLKKIFPMYSGIAILSVILNYSHYYHIWNV